MRDSRFKQTLGNNGGCEDSCLLKELKRSSLAGYQPDQLRKMQRNDPDI